MSWAMQQQSNSSSMWGGGGQGSSNSNGFGTPMNGQQQQQPGYGFSSNNPNNNTTSGYGTPSAASSSSQPFFSSSSYAPPTQNMYSTASYGMQQQQQQQQQPQQQQNNQQYQQGTSFQSLQGNSMSQQPPQQQTYGQYSGNASFSNQPQQQHMSNQQQQPQQGFYQPNMGSFIAHHQNSTSAANTASPGQERAPPRFMSSFFSGAAQSPARSYESKSPEQTPRDLAGSNSGARGLRGSTASGGTGGGRDSPSRSPRQSLYATRAGLVSSSRMRQSTAASSSSQGDGDTSGMDEDAPPTTSLDEYDESNMSTQFSTSPQPIGALTNGISSPPSVGALALPGSGRRPTENGNASASTSNGVSTPLSSLSGGFKIVVFGFPPDSRQDVVRQFTSLGPVSYNSSSTSKPEGSQKGDTGANWFTLGYESTVSAQRAIARHGDVISGFMIGVKYADAASAAAASSADQQASDSQHNQSSTSLGTPARVLPASAAFLKPKPSSAHMQVARSATSSRLADLGKIDPKVFQQPSAQTNGQADKKQANSTGGGVISTVTNLIFGF